MSVEHRYNIFVCGLELTEKQPTPQQNDSWSCGVRVVWNFRRLANNLPIGDWDTTLSPERMKMEIVEGFTTCIEGGAMKRYRE